MNETLTAPEKTDGDAAPPESPRVPPVRPKKKRSRKKIIKLIIGLVISAAAITGITIATLKIFFSPEPVYFKTGTVTRTDYLSMTSEGYGYCRPTESLPVNTAIGGAVLESYISEGMIVNEGDLLCKIDGAEIDKAIAGIEKEIETLQGNIDKLLAQISKANQDISVVNKEQQEQQDSSVMLAPFDGKAMNVEKHTLGDYISRGEKIATIVDDRKMILRQFFSFGYVNDVKVGQKAQVSIPSTMSVVEGSVTRVETAKSVHPDGTVAFEVEITITNPGALTKDMAATASIKTPTETILPAMDGVLEFGREQHLFAGANGNLLSYNLHNYYSYSQGQTLMKIEFIKDTSAVEGYYQAIRTYQEQIDTINADIETKREKIAENQVLYEQLEMKAPMTGTVMYSAVTVGQKVEPGFTVCNIADMREMLLDANVDQQNIGNFFVGMPVKLTIYNNMGQMEMEGKVKSISLEAKNEYGYAVFPCVISFDNSNNIAGSGAGIQYTAIIEESVGPLVVPIDAVKPTEHGECLFVQMDSRPDNAVDLPPGTVPDGFYAVPVVCGISTREQIEIREGAEEGWIIYTQKSLVPTPTPDPEAEEGAADTGGKPMPAVRIG